MSQPEEIAKADPLDADPSLVGAPLNVRKASAWLAALKASGGLWRVRALAVLPAVFALSGAIGASVAHDAFHQPGVAGALFATGVVAMIASGAYGAWSQRPYVYATNLVDRYRKLQELGAPAPTPIAETPIDRMVARIDALAGDDRTEVREAAQKAREHAAWLRQELDQLAKMGTGQPQVDAALDAARERLDGDLARTQARVAELYASLVDLQAGGPVDELRLATERIAAELEVDAKLASARRSAGKQRA